MSKQKMSGLLANGSMRSAGVTFYTKQGKTIVRTSHSMQPKRRTRAQFDVRQRTRHTTALWQMMKNAAPMFTGGKSTYACFASLTNRLPVVYLPNTGTYYGASLLLPGMPLAYGTLEPVTERLGEVNGAPALLTSLKKSDMRRGEELRLYTVKQLVKGACPKVNVKMEVVTKDDFVMVDGCLALVGDRFADDMAGWAVVRVDDDRCSTQTVVTRCTYYERFTTEEALQEAAKSYGGLTELK